MTGRPAFRKRAVQSVRCSAQLAHVVSRSAPACCLAETGVNLDEAEEHDDSAASTASHHTDDENQQLPESAASIHIGSPEHGRGAGLLPPAPSLHNAICQPLPLLHNQALFGNVCTNSFHGSVLIYMGRAVDSCGKPLDLDLLPGKQGGTHRIARARAKAASSIHSGIPVSCTGSWAAAQRRRACWTGWKPMRASQL